MDDIFNILKNYQDNPSNESTGELLTTGIVLLTEYVNTTVMKFKGYDSAIGEIFATCVTPLARYLALNIYVHHFSHHDDVLVRTKELSHFIKDLHGAFHIAKCRGEILAKDKLDEALIKYLIDRVTIPFQRSVTDGAKESIVTSCAPIVPYIGTIKAPFIGSTDVKVEAPDDMKLIAVSIIANLLCEPANVQSILDYMEHVPMINNLKHIPPYIVAPNSTILPSEVVTYFTNFFVFKNWDRLSSEERKSIITFTNPAMESFTDLMNASMSITPDSVLSCLDAIQDDESTMTMIHKFGGKVISRTDEIPAFDIDYLMAFIFTRRHLRVNHYTNSAFANLPSIASITFYKNFMLIQPCDENNKPMPYLYIPMINDLANSEIQILKFYADRRISVLTKDQYMHDIAYTNTLNQIPDEV